jgi:hypothetical protein
MQKIYIPVMKSSGATVLAHVSSSHVTHDVCSLNGTLTKILTSLLEQRYPSGSDCTVFAKFE